MRVDRGCVIGRIALQPSEASAKWIDENLIIRWNDEEGTHTGFERRGDAVVVEASIVEDMVENIEKDNLTVGFLD
jgi:hypothetical protein